MKAALKSLAIVICMLSGAGLGWLCLQCKKPVWRDRVMMRASGLLLFLVGVRLKVSGAQSASRPLLVVSNHVSYLDILVLGSQAPVRFTPKIEIAGWPMIGWMCRVHGALFVDRRPEKVKEMGDMLKKEVAGDVPICVFPEATTNNGLQLLPFKSSFFSLAETSDEQDKVFVQPVAITYTHIRNLPIGMTQWPHIAWYGDMDLVPHLWNLLKIAPVSVHLKYLPPVSLQQFGDRKALANHCHQVISEAIKE
jgi:1-acyl-sn-glycerol-3-phosphate acyltransferase